MPTDTHQQVMATVSVGRGSLRSLSMSSEQEMTSLARAFRELATLARQNLSMAGETIAAVGEGDLDSVTDKVEEFCRSLKMDLENRLQAIGRLMEVLTGAAQSFDALSQTMAHQRAVAVQFKALSVLTQVEIANLGGADGDMRHLTEELSRFAENVSADTMRISGDTEWQRMAVQDAAQVFQAGIPRMQSQLLELGKEVESALPGIRGRLSQLRSVPEVLRGCLQQTSQKIDAVVAAIQGYDITRQQLEHVQAALAMIASPVKAGIHFDTRASLQVQKMQLENIQGTVRTWLAQIRDCVTEIGRLSAADLSDAGHIVLEEAGALAAQLARMQNLQQSSEAQAEIIGASLGRISGLLALVNEHMRRSEQIRDELQILVLNSIVGSMRMGPQGAVVSRIAKLINASSEQWNLDILDSKRTLMQIAELVREVNELMSVFSGDQCRQRHDSHRATQWMLERVGGIAREAAGRAAHINNVSGHMRRMARDVYKATDQLESGFEELESVLLSLENVISRLQFSQSQGAERPDAAAIERMFSPLYTTETERQVMRAALRGTPAPIPQETFRGNDVELF